MITVVGRERKEVKIEKSATLAELATIIGIRLSAYVALRNGKPITSDEMVSPQDEITFLEVFSGG